MVHGKMAEAEGPASAAPQPPTAPRSVLIAIPFYKNEHLVAEVVGSLIRCGADLQALGAEVVLYDDSPDYAPLGAALTEMLPAAVAVFPCRIERNSSNLGFIRTVNKAIAEAVSRRFDLLLLNSDTIVEPGALVEMARVSRLDPMIGFVNPRSNNATIATLPLAARLGDCVSRESYRALAAMLPDLTYVPTAIGFCLLIRWNIIAEFGGLDVTYGAGYNEENDLVMRAGRCGYRAVFANHAFVWHRGEQSFGAADLSRDRWEPFNRAVLLRRYPEYATCTAAHFSAPETVAELLAAELIPDGRGRLDFAFDFSSFVPHYNGTFLHGQQLLAAASKALGDLFNICVLCSKETFDFFGYAEFGAQRCDPNGAEKFAVIFRVGQPYEWEEMKRLAEKAAVVGIYMLDTISIDCPQLASQRLFNLWQFALEQSDMIAAPSRMTLAQLQRRFHIPERVTVSTILQSLDVEDYRIPGTGAAQPGTGSLLVLGNHYQHKHLAPTANALAKAFPDRTIIALGLEKPEKECNVEAYAPQHLSQSENLTGIAAGGLGESELGALYARADVVVFPTHYEGFGMPVLNALAAHRPIFVRNLSVFEELWRELERNPNIHFYETTGELIERLRDIPKWTAAPAIPGRSAAEALRKIREALDAARERVGYGRIVERLRAVQLIGEIGSVATGLPDVVKEEPRISVPADAGTVEAAHESPQEGASNSMKLLSDLNEFIAGITWPLRGRKVTMRLERDIREDLGSEIRRIESGLRTEIEALRNDTLMVSWNVAAFVRQLDDFRRTLERSLAASEKSTEEKFALLLDRIANVQEAGGKLAQGLPQQAAGAAAPVNGAPPATGDDWQENTSNSAPGKLQHGGGSV